MEKYYVPVSKSLTDETSFAIVWNGANYRLFDDCVTRPSGTEPSDFDYMEISPWGYTVDIGTTQIFSDSKLIVGSSCTTDTNDILVASISRSIFDAPNFSPYEPIYFLGFFVLSVWMIIFSIKLFFGRGYA